MAITDYFLENEFSHGGAADITISFCNSIDNIPINLSIFICSPFLVYSTNANKTTVCLVQNIFFSCTPVSEYRKCYYCFNKT